MSKFPDFDDVDLAIIAIAIILLSVVGLSFTKGLGEGGLGVISAGITAIATLAGRKLKEKLSDDSNTTTNGGENV